MLGFLPSALVAAVSFPLAQLAGQAGRGSALDSVAIHGSIILLLCVAAGIGTFLLLPSRTGARVRGAGGALLIATGLILCLLLARSATQQGQRVHLYFWIFSAIALVGALRVVTHPRPVYSALYFVLTVFASAGLFILLSAEFMAAALVLIYAGAILITYVFVIMLAAQARTPDTATQEMFEYDTVSREPAVAAAIGFALTGVLLFVIFDRFEGIPRTTAATSVAVADRDDEVPGLDGATQRLGLFLFKKHQVSLELAGLILTVSMVGAIVIARRRVLAAETAQQGPRPVVVSPATPISDDPHSIPVYGTRNPEQKAYPET